MKDKCEDESRELASSELEADYPLADPSGHVHFP